MSKYKSAEEEAEALGLPKPEPEKRKVIQVSVGEYLTLALCNDGTLWSLNGGNIHTQRHWVPFPEPPQP